MKPKSDNIFADHQGDVPQDVLLRYVNGFASPEESRWVEEKMADDPFLSDAVDGMMKINNPGKAQQDLKVIHEVIRKKSNANSRVISLQNRWLQLAAALVILMSSIWFINNNLNKSAEKIFTNEFKPYPSPSTLNEPTVLSDASVKEEQKSAFSDSIVVSKNKAIVTTKEPAAANQNQNTESERAEEVQSVPDLTLYKDDVKSETALSEEDIQDKTIVFENKKIASDNSIVPPSSKAVPNSQQFVEQPASTLSSVEGISSSNDPNDGYAIARQRELDEIKTNMKAALDYYHATDYVEAINGFEKVLKEDNNNDAANFYAGVSYLAISNADAALGKLKKLDNKKNGSYYEAALWYESLAYVQKGDKRTATAILQKLINLNGEHRVEAEALLKKL
ncbi:MAG: hypothetical protein IPO83_17645 [Chitinophagaceae bacterium]|nr:hypothetical protein [Chitinophagaceae bacterium]